MKIQKIVSIAFGSIGALFFVIGVFILIKEINFKNKAAGAKGIIIDYDVRTETSGSSKGHQSTHTYYFPIIEFSVNETKYKFTSNASYSKEDGPVGSEIEILYDPADPNNAEMKSGTLLVPIIFIGLGILAILLSVILFRNAKRRNTPA